MVKIYLLAVKTQMIDIIEYFISYMSLTSILNSKDLLHKTCTNLFSSAPHFELTQALICGKKLPKNETRLLLSQAGMMHLLVVSGYHLGLFQRLWSLSFKKIFVSTKIELFALALYSVMTGWQPPVVRALIERTLKTKVHEHQSILLSFIITILLHPSWTASLSLHLSLIARGAIYISNGRSVFTLTSVVTVSLCPLLFMHNPVTSFFSLLVSPFFLFSIFFHSFIVTMTNLLPLYFLEENTLNLSSWLIDINLKFLTYITKFFSNVDPVILIKHPYLRLLYLSVYLVLIYAVGICRYRNAIATPYSIKKEPSYFSWALLILFILSLQPNSVA